MSHLRSCGIIDREFSQIIRGIRRELRMSQKEIAEHMGVTYQQIQKYEAGKNRVSIGRAHQIARAFGISLSDLVSMLDG